jgi:choline dehydrogenase-like flavoprotein
VVVREISVDKNTGLASEAHFVDCLSRREMSVKARGIVLVAGALESSRLLLNSKLANSSGVMGHYLVDQVYGPGIVSSVPEARNGKATLALISGGALIPRFRNINTKAKNFIRGYALNVHSSMNPMNPRNFAAYGEELQNKLDSYNGSGFSTGIMGEVLARYETCKPRQERGRCLGHSSAAHRDKYTDNEFNMARDAVDTSIALAEAASFEVLSKKYHPNLPGYSIHELGTCRMGDNPKTSVLNQWSQSHDVKNLFVVDGSSFVSSGRQNPTMTIVALAMRASDYLAEQMRQGNV